MQQLRPQREHRPRGVPRIGKIGRGEPSARCSDRPSPALLQGIEEFNTRKFFECHETLEALWVEETDPIRYLYQGILQVGVGLYHLLRGNFTGAVGLLERGIRLLQAFLPGCMGVDVALLVAEAGACRRRLLELGKNRFHEFDMNMIPTVRLAEQAGASAG